MINFCNLYSGSSGNSTLFSSAQTNLLIDAGVSGKKTEEALKSLGISPYDIDAIIISHEHTDHIKGAGILSKRYDIPVYANENTWQVMCRSIKQISVKNMRSFTTGEAFCIKDTCIMPFNIPHDAIEPVGFCIFAGNNKVCIATDMGHITQEFTENAEKSDLLLIEANHDIEMLKCGPYPWELKRRILGDKGHLSNDAAAEIVVHMARKGTKRFILGHLSRENNFPELAHQTVCNFANQNGITPNLDITLDVALREQPGRFMAI